MNWLKKYIQHIKPHFEKGGRFEKLHSAFDAFETFLFVPDTTTSAGSHIRDAIDMKRAMVMVIIALIPPLLFGVFNTGYQYFVAHGKVFNQSFFFADAFLFGLIKVLPVIIVTYVTGLGIEFIMAQVRGHEVNEGFLVTGMLIPLIMPPDIPLWMVALATAFAVFFGKEIFGGTGMNIMNPALLARSFIFFAYPGFISGSQVWVSGMTETAGLVDGYSGETALGQLSAGATAIIDGFGREIPFRDLFFGLIPGCIGETSKLAILMGALFLLITGIASWRIMLSVFAGGFCMGLIFNLIAANSYMQLPAHYHLVLGGFAFGAVYMATDPVSGAQTAEGKIVYGLLIGALIIAMRVFNPAYPEATMLTILLMNVFAPLIDHLVVQGNISRRLKRGKIKVH